MFGSPIGQSGYRAYYKEFISRENAQKVANRLKASGEIVGYRIDYIGGEYILNVKLKNKLPDTRPGFMAP